MATRSFKTIPLLTRTNYLQYQQQSTPLLILLLLLLLLMKYSTNLFNGLYMEFLQRQQNTDNKPHPFPPDHTLPPTRTEICSECCLSLTPYNHAPPLNTQLMQLYPTHVQLRPYIGNYTPTHMWLHPLLTRDHIPIHSWPHTYLCDHTPTHMWSHTYHSDHTLLTCDPTPIICDHTLLTCDPTPIMRPHPTHMWPHTYHMWPHPTHMWSHTYHMWPHPTHMWPHTYHATTPYSHVTPHLSCDHTLFTCDLTPLLTHDHTPTNTWPHPYSHVTTPILTCDHTPTHTWLLHLSYVTTPIICDHTPIHTWPHPYSYVTPTPTICDHTYHMWPHPYSQHRYVEIPVECGHRLSVRGIIGVRREELVHGLQVCSLALVHFSPRLMQSSNGEMIQTSNNCQQSIITMELEEVLYNNNNHSKISPTNRE